MTVKPNLTNIAGARKSLMAFVAKTISNYNRVAIELHQSACMVFYHAAEHGDCDGLNLFYNGLRVNDQTALRVWIGENATYLDMESNTVKPWMNYTQAKGFGVVKGKEDKRKDLFTIDVAEEGKTMLIALKPFYERNVKDPTAITLETLILMLEKAAKRVVDTAEKEGIVLTDGMTALVNEIERDTAVEKAALKVVPN